MLAAAAPLLLPFRTPPPTMTASFEPTVEQTSHRLFNGRGFFIRATAVGNAGFDPLGLASQTELLVPLRQAELKHGRLAMIAMIALPAQEMIHPMLAGVLGAPNLLVGGLSPSLINGGLDPERLSQAPQLAAAFALGAAAMAAVETRDIRARSQDGLAFNEWAGDSVAGAVGFDPLGITTDMPATERFELQEAEMLNGRLAMLAAVWCVMQECRLGMPVAMPALML